METTLRAFPALSAVRPCNSLRYWRTDRQSSWLAPYRYSPGDIPSRNLQLQTANRSLGFLTLEIPATFKKNEEKKRFFEVGTYRRVHSYHIWLQSLCQHANDQSSSCFCMTALAVITSCVPKLFSMWKYRLLQELPTKYKKRKNKENQDSFDFFLQYAHLQAW